MSEQEMKQGEIIEAIFNNFDCDGSGSLDINELVELFRQNGINLDKFTVRQMFMGNHFNLQKFKSMMDSDTDLKRFQAILKMHKDKILRKQEPTFKMSVLENQSDEMSPKFLQKNSHLKIDS